MKNRFRMCSLLALVVFLSSGCGLVGEDPSRVPPHGADDYQAVCSLPEAKALESADERQISQWLDCADQQIQDVQAKVRGKVNGELSAAELRYLNEKGLLGFRLDDLVWETVPLWLGLFHSEGRSGFQWRLLKESIQLVRKHLKLALEWRELLMAEPMKVQLPLILKSLTALPDVVNLVSEAGQIDLAAAQQLYSVAVRYEEERSGRTVPFGRDFVEPVWVLKSLVLEARNEDGVRGPLRAAAIKKLLNLGIETLAHSPAIIEWTLDELAPHKMPPQVEREFSAALDKIIGYFANNKFAAIETQLAQWAIRKIGVGSSLYELVPDLVRILQRLTLPTGTVAGIHPNGLVPLLVQAKKLGPEVAKVSRLNWEWRDYSHTIKRSEAIADETLGGVAYVVRREPEYGGPNRVVKVQVPALERISWIDTLSSLINRQVLRAVFSTFDQDGDGKISYLGRNADETREAVDLAYTVLRVLSFSSVERQKNSELEEPPTWAPVKPGALFRTLGLIGDRWFPSGNRNGLIEADELALAMLFNQEIQNASTYTNLTSRKYLPEASVPKYGMAELRKSYWQVSRQDTVHDRTEFVRESVNALSYSLPWMNSQLEQMPKDVAVALVDGLVEKSKRSTRAYSLFQDRVAEPLSEVFLEDVSYSQDILPFAAVIAAVDKLFLACDKPDMKGVPDGVLNWQEMDCALPLATEAALQVVLSNLVELDPGVHDATRLLLALVGKPGPALAVLKVAASMGSYRSIPFQQLQEKIELWSQEELEVNSAQVETFIRGTEGLITKGDMDWTELVKVRYQRCDIDSDGKFKGPELDRLVDETISAWFSRFMPSILVRAGLLNLSNTDEGRLIRLALKLAMANSEVDLQTFSKVELPLTATPASILSLLAELLERSEPVRAAIPQPFPGR